MDAYTQAGLDAGLDPSLAAYMPRYVQIESGGNPNAQTGSYSGLLQMGPDERKQYGGNGFAMYADRAKQFQDKFGRQPSPTELYLANQQGIGGLSAHLGNPSAPAWMNMFSTAEGQRKGQGWAQQAIWGNIPNAAKAQFGNVNNVSSQDFVNLWQHRVEGAPFQRGNAPMADYNNAPPALSQEAMQGQQPVLFGGNPTPVGFMGALGKALGIGSADELGRHLQNAGAALIAVGNPSGGAALQNAANMPLFRQRFGIMQDSLNNRIPYNLHSGAGLPGSGVDAFGRPLANGQAGGGNGQADGELGTSQVLARSPLALAKKAELDQANSAEKMKALEDAAAQAQGIIDQNKRATALSQNPNVIQGPGFWNMLKEKAAENSNGSVGGIDLSAQAELDKINSQLVGSMLSSQKGIRFAAPEIKFGENASADREKPAAANQQIYSNNIQNAQRMIDARDIARAHMAKYGVLGPEYSRDLQAYQDKHPVFQDTPNASAQKAAGFKILKVHPTE